jgi:hypothetical protein
MSAKGLHWELLAKAAKARKADDFSKYFEIKDLLATKAPEARAKFRRLFTQWYGLNSAGLTDAFRDRYFQLLFAAKPVGKRDPYSSILLDLYEIPRRKGDPSLQCSFVSKLVAIHDESRPIYDVYVREFFGMAPPSVGSIKFRVAGFVANIDRIREEYGEWAQSPRFQGVVEPLFKMNPSLRHCHPHRALDVLVWTVGAWKIT